MGKKQQGKDEAPNPNSVVNREIFQRLNFLYQASTYLKGLEAAGLPRSNIGATDEVPHKKGKRRKASLGDLGCSYVQNMRTIGNKTVVRMDPNVKRTLCRGCDTILVSGTTASVRIKGSLGTGHKVTYTCLECRTSRVIPAPPTMPTSASQMASSSNPLPVPTTSKSLQDTLGGLDTPPTPAERQSPRRRKKRRPPVPHPWPLFARQDAGHVVFRGNEVLNEDRE